LLRAVRGVEGQHAGAAVDQAPSVDAAVAVRVGVELRVRDEVAAVRMEAEHVAIARELQELAHAVARIPSAHEARTIGRVILRDPAVVALEREVVARDPAIVVA
jgi:hypothetical protein